MEVYSFFLVIITLNIVFMILFQRNARYVISRMRQHKDAYTPAVLLSVPCKGIDFGFEDNMKSFFDLQYPDFILNFIVESCDDPAYEVLVEMKKKLEQVSTAKEVNILVAGLAEAGSQKNHNLLFSIERNSKDVSVLAFADSDARVNKYWLVNLVHPLRKERSGATTGYRWILPIETNFASLMLCSLNGMVAQLLGRSIFNQAWGGSMAIRRELFFSVGLEKLWRSCISDDLSLTYAVKKSGYRIRYVPRGLTATYERMNFGELLEFGRRQFLITRKTLPSVWLGGLMLNLYGVLGYWGSIALLIYAASIQSCYLVGSMVVFLSFLAGQIHRIHMRYRIACCAMPENEHIISKCRIFDYATIGFGALFMFLFMLSSLFGNTITWRGKKYRIHDGCKTTIVPK